jgi:hypothetical protein
MRIRLGNRHYNLRFVEGLPQHGDIDEPSEKNKQIRINDNLTGEVQLEVLIHEMLHGLYDFLDESYVEQPAKDLARALWRIGYRVERFFPDESKD